MIRLLKKAAIFILIALVAIFIVEISCRIIKIPKITHHNIMAKSRNLVPKISKNSILFLGDSRIEWGIKPLEILEALDSPNLTVINLALPGSNGIDILKYLINNKIYPSQIVAGFSPFYGAYTNHSLDTINYSWEDRIKANVKYLINQNFYISDRSINEYLRRELPLYKDHQYDPWGGVIVSEYGDYSQRLDYQVETSMKMRDSFDSSGYTRYVGEMNSLIKAFRENGTSFVGIYMPVDKKIYEIESSLPISEAHKISFDKYFDFSAYTYTVEPAQHDSTYSYDGSHLAHEYSYIFSRKLADYLK